MGKLFENRIFFNIPRGKQTLYLCTYLNIYLSFIPNWRGDINDRFIQQNSTFSNRKFLKPKCIIGNIELSCRCKQTEYRPSPALMLQTTSGSLTCTEHSRHCATTLEYGKSYCCNASKYCSIKKKNTQPLRKKGCHQVWKSLEEGEAYVNHREGTTIYSYL